MCLVHHFLHLLDRKDGMVRLDMDSIKRVKVEIDKGKVRGCEMIGRSSFHVYVPLLLMGNEQVDIMIAYIIGSRC